MSLLDLSHHDHRHHTVMSTTICVMLDDEHLSPLEWGYRWLEYPKEIESEADVEALDREVFRQGVKKFSRRIMKSEMEALAAACDGDIGDPPDLMIVEECLPGVRTRRFAKKNGKPLRPS